MSRLIAIEGTDGSGKGTQAARLVASLVARNTPAELLSFPRYADTQFGHTIGRFLNGEFGPLAHVAPELAAVLYAGDRFESRDVIRASLENNQVTICDRYVPSNLAHQGSRVAASRQQDVICWIERMEHEIFGLPVADLVIWLDVPPDISRQLIAKKAARDYTEREADLQEENLEYQRGVHAVYASLAASRDRWTRVEGVDPSTGEMRTIDDIAGEILGIVDDWLQD